MSAIFSEDRRYRYLLRRSWAPAGVPAARFVAIGLNPSTAGEVDNDTTVNRLVGHAQDHGCNELVLVNLFALVATDPRVMRAVLERNRAEAVGPLNNQYIDEAVHEEGIKHVVAMWGNLNKIEARRWVDVMDRVWSAGHDLECFGQTKSKHPKHPARMAKHLELMPWPPGVRHDIPDSPFDIPVERQVRKLPPLWARQRRASEAVAALRAEGKVFVAREGQPICKQCEMLLGINRYTHNMHPNKDQPGFWVTCKCCGQPSGGWRWMAVKHAPQSIDLSDRPRKDA